MPSPSASLFGATAAAPVGNPLKSAAQDVRSKQRKASWVIDAVAVRKPLRDNGRRSCRKSAQERRTSSAAKDRLRPTPATLAPCETSFRFGRAPRTLLPLLAPPPCALPVRGGVVISALDARRPRVARQRARPLRGRPVGRSPSSLPLAPPAVKGAHLICPRPDPDTCTTPRNCPRWTPCTARWGSAGCTPCRTADTDPG